MLEYKPIAHATEDGRVAVFIGGAYANLPRDKARSLFTQLQTALDVLDPPAERDARELALWRKEADLAGQQDAHPLARSIAAKLKARVAMQLVATEQANG